MKNLFLLISLLLSIAANASDLTVTVTNIESAAGRISVALYNSPKGFPNSMRLAGQQVPAKAGSVKVIFLDVPPGIYAISAYQDTNSNEALDTSFVGAPSEPYGFSRGARATFGPPSFNDASFKIDAPIWSEEVKLK